MSKPSDLVVPALGESITEAVIGKWLVDVGEHVDADDPVVDLETDKITVQLPAPVSGALSERKFKEGDTVKVGDIVGLIEAGAAKAKSGSDTLDAKAEPKAESKKAAPAESDGGAQDKKAASLKAESKPATKEIQGVPERDDEGRLLSPSQRRAMRSGEQVPHTSGSRPSSSGKSGRGKVANPKSAGPREEIVAMSPLRKRIAERLVQAQHTSASLTTFNEIDMTNIMGLRKRYQENFVKEHEVKLGFMSFAVKACVASLKQFPGLNAEIRGESIVYKKHYDLGIAVGTPKGLVVPVVRDCDSRSFAQVEQGINELAAKARTNKLALDDLMGGTFSITNGGVYGSMMSTPLLNFPQTGILGMHNIIQRPMAVDGEVKVRPMMYLALTYDHRVVDGREAVQFLVGVKERMEDPERLLFGV